MFSLQRFFRFLFRSVQLSVLALALFFKQTYRDEKGSEHELSNPIRLRLFCEQAGGAFIKFGQLLSLRNDLLSSSYTEELLQLLSNVPIAPFFEMERVFIEEFGKPPELYFKTFNTNPVGSASIAQVYHATLDTGESVAVKIKRPGIDEIFEQDFLVVSFAVDVFGIFQIVKALRLKEAVLVFIAWTRRELDFRHEAANMAAIFKHAEKHPDTVVPKIYADRSTPKVLVSEYLDNGAFQVSHVMQELHKNPSFGKLLHEAHRIDLEKMSNYLVEDMMRQIFIDGFFHADPHPSNIYVLPGNKLAYIDFGIVGEASAKRLHLLRFAYGVVKQDIHFAAKGFISYSHQILEEELSVFQRQKNGPNKKLKKALDKIEEIIAENFEKDMHAILLPWYDAIGSGKEDPARRARANEKNIWQRKNVAVVFAKLAIAIRAYGFYVPEEVLLFFRTLAIVDMVALHLHSKFNLVLAMNLFFEKNHFSRIEEIIMEESHKKELAGGIEPTEQEGFEEMIELQVIEREKLHRAEEILGERIAYYAERHEEVRALLK
ncbi:MAG: AarF/ABC1/UbiB kinase family protein [Parcubacteria group bacterium]|nr:AarF/ABC1/UbiB kinase family protein [Parcubacteria group bacterium]